MATLLEVPLATTLLLLCAAPTSLSRSGGFPGPDDALDEPGRHAAAACVLPARFAGDVLHAPSRAAAETAAAMALAARIEPALADIDHGTWSGRSFEAVASADPAALPAWLADPLQGTPGGETMAQVQARIGHWLDAIAAVPGTPCALTHAMPIRAALAHALGIPLPATLAIDVAPLSRVMLSFNGRWRLQSLGLD